MIPAVDTPKWHSATDPGVIGVVPAAGRALRLGPLACSKEILPVWGGWSGAARPLRPVAEAVLESMATAGIREVLVVIDPAKTDIPATLGDGTRLGLHLRYPTVTASRSIPETIDRTFPLLKGRVVAIGFPDIIFQPRGAFSEVLRNVPGSGADVVLGLVPTDRPDKVDMVETDSRGWVRRLLIKPARTRLRLTWIAAVWTPAVTDFLHEILPRLKRKPRQELYPGHVLQAAIDAGFGVRSVTFESGSHLDIGTPEDLERARRRGRL